MQKIIVTCGLLVIAAVAVAQDAAPRSYTQDAIKQGSELYARHCSACHGLHMKNPEGAFDLLKFPPDQQERFINSVSKGKNSMPPWGGLLKPDEIAALWAYVIAGEKN